MRRGREIKTVLLGMKKIHHYLISMQFPCSIAFPCPVAFPFPVKCTQSEIGDEFHYIFNCPFFADQRRTYLPKYLHIHPSAPKFKSIRNDKKNYVI